MKRVILKKKSGGCRSKYFKIVRGCTTGTVPVSGTVPNLVCAPRSAVLHVKIVLVTKNLALRYDR